MLSDLCYQLQRRCLCQGCTNLIPDFAPLHKRYCQALCRANAWSRANRDFCSRITVADFENIREYLKQYQSRSNRVVVGYALVRSHPIADVARQIGPSTFPPKDRKTKRMADESGRTRFKSTAYFSLVPHFEAPRVPVKGKYRLKVVFEGDTTMSYETGVELVVNKAFPAVHFYEEKTGQRYTLKGEAIPPQAPKPPKPPTERMRRRPPAAIGPQPEREASTERVAVVPATAAQRAPDAELVAQGKKNEEERALQTKERADLLATLSRERTLRQELEQKLLRATSMPKPPAKDDRSLRLEAAEKRSLDAQMKELRQLLSQLQGRVTELENKNTSLTKERDALTTERDALKLANATLASQIIPLNDRATNAERDRTELTATLLEVKRQRDELASKPANQAAPAATAVPSATAVPAEPATADAGAASTPPTGPTGIIRLALSGNLSPASSPKTGPPGLGILGQNHRSPIRGSANKKHKRR